MSEQPIKLTDEVINSIVMHPGLKGGPYTAEIQHAIRALRDRAKAVVEAYESRQDAHPGSYVWRGRMMALDALREVLP